MKSGQQLRSLSRAPPSEPHAGQRSETLQIACSRDEWVWRGGDCVLRVCVGRQLEPERALGTSRPAREVGEHPPGRCQSRVWVSCVYCRRARLGRG